MEIRKPLLDAAGRVLRPILCLAAEIGPGVSDDDTGNHGNDGDGDDNGPDGMALRRRRGWRNLKGRGQFHG